MSCWSRYRHRCCDRRLRGLSGLATLLLLALFGATVLAQDRLSRATSIAAHREALRASVCSGLHDHYSALHADILAGKAPQKFLVYISPPSGLADRLTGLVAAFYYALLTQRALLIPPDPMPYELLYDQPSINWTVPLPPGNITAPCHYPAVARVCTQCGSTPNPPGVDPLMNCGSCLDDGHGPVAYQNWINSGSARDWHMATNLTATYPDVHTLYYTSNRGASVPLFHNVFHQRRLHELGLRPSTAFGCAYNMVFFPKEETLAVMGEELKQLLPEPLLIGIQIRTNDNHMAGEGLAEEVINGYKAMLDCAASLEQSLGRGMVSAKFFLVSDSTTIRHRASTVWYPGKVVVYVRSNPTHIQNSGKDDLHGSRLAAAEHWLFGMTDFQVIHWWSGYGRTAAMRAMREMSIHAWADNIPAQCNADNQQSAWQVGTGYSGVRRMMAQL